MRPLLATLVLAVAFVFATGSSLPPVVAAHFTAGGGANGFMPLGTYRRFTITLLLGLPLLITLISSLTSVLPPNFINLPNREYWLAPERQAETLRYLRKTGSRFGIILAVFLCFVHWLVVQANAHIPPRFPESMLFIGTAAFLVGLGACLGDFIVVHFRKPP
jgi:hypothetical protein